MSEPTAITIADYMRKPENMARFEDLLGGEAKPYVQSVLIAVTSSADLMQCTPHSIQRSALRAASLGLSCDPALKQAWLIPYNRKVKVKDEKGAIVGEKWIKEAQFQPHYKGLHALAMRTGKYVNINVGPIYEGQRVMENPLTGLHAVQEKNGFLGQPQAYNSAYSRDVTVRRDQNQKVVGWLGYFKTTRGFEKSIYMSLEEISEYAQKYVKEYAKNPNWNDPTKRPTMEMKTVLRQLLAWADLSGKEHSALKEALDGDGVGADEGENGNVIDTDAIDAPAPEDAGEEGEKKTETELLKGPGYNPAAAIEKRPLSPEALRQFIADRAAYHRLKKTPAKDNLVQVVAMNLKEIFGDCDDHEERRKAMTYFLTGHESLKDLEAYWLLALKDWLHPTQDTGGAWIVDAMSEREAQAVYTAALEAQGQQKLPLENA